MSVLNSKTKEVRGVHDTKSGIAYCTPNIKCLQFYSTFYLFTPILLWLLS